ncbi:MAG: hypothetical protein ACRDTF_20745 [Pseudonocardiaceae bacterium]
MTLALMLAFVVGDPLGLLGAVFAVSVLALVTGKVSPRAKKALVTTHFVFSGSWLGVGVVAKLLISIAIIASAFGFLHLWVVSAAERSALLEAAGGGVAVGELGIWLVTGFGTAVFFVAVAMVLSVYKPWGKTRFAGR